MFLGSTSRSGFKALAWAGLLSLMAACTSTGNSFNTTALHQLVPGQTTLDEAIVVLGADPVNTYRQLDGSATSIWSHKNSMVTDAVYFNQELWLAFGPDGRFQRVVKKHNLPVAPPPGHASASANPPVPVHQEVVAAPVPLAPTPVIVPASMVEVAPTPPALVIDHLDSKQPVVSYPVNH